MRVMPLDGEYAPRAAGWAQDQTDEIVKAGTTTAVGDGKQNIVLVTYRGRRTGLLRKMPLVRVEHGGEYALVASMGGAPKNPDWYANIVADPHVEIMDGAVTGDYDAHEATGEEKETWWARSVEVFPPYADYQEKTERQIPVFVAVPRS
jgi:deazaflavin-dependent oxidoreductase (nitroreductase family)